jgi:hypothetical protein
MKGSDFVWVFNKPNEQDVVQLPEPQPPRGHTEDVWWGIMMLLLRIFT